MSRSRNKGGEGAAAIIAGLAIVSAAIVRDEVRAGRGLCLIGRHSWWECEAAENHYHRHCRRCDAYEEHPL